MSIDLSRVTGISDSRGVITEIKDSLGRVIWSAVTGKPAVLQVAKQTLTTYAGETEYAGESFVAIDVYPRKNGTVKVTYGGLTKTVKDTSGAEKPNAQTVYFGTMYGVTDSVTTPASGELTIEGGYNNFAAGVYKANGKTGVGIAHCGCITGVTDWGNVETEIVGNAFRGCTSLTLTSLPSGITRIGDYAFYSCSSLALASLPNGITYIGNHAFNGCTGQAISKLPTALVHIGNSAFENLKGVTVSDLPSGLAHIGDYAFSGCSSFALTSLPSGLTYIGKSAFYNVSSITLNALPSGLTYIGNRAFYISGGSSDYGGFNTDKVSLNFSSLPSGLTYIGSYASFGNDNLTIVDASNATEIGSYAFHISSITKVVMGDNLTKIGDEAFAFANGLIEVTIGKNVTSIGNRAFESLGKNKKYTFLSPTPLVVFTSSYIFGHEAYGSIAQIIVPKGCGDAYRTALSYYADKIVEAS